MSKIIKVSEDKNNYRLDKFLADSLSELSRNKIQELISLGFILLNGKSVKASAKIETNDEISILDYPKETTCVEPEDIPLDIIYEDEGILLINKPVGLIVHPGAGHKEHTLVNALVNYSNKLSNVSGDFRPGIVHRLDKDTSGILVIAKNDATHNALAKQLKERTFIRKYIALVEGEIVENSGKIIAPIGRDKKNRLKMAVDLNGKPAETHFKVLKRYQNYTLLECQLISGRTHQIRVHLAYINHPVVGDIMYGKKSKLKCVTSYLLFAYMIAFKNPNSGLLQSFSLQIPPLFQNVLNELGDLFLN